VPVTEASTWTSNNSNKAKPVISNLTGGMQYAFRVAGIGTNPTVVYSYKLRAVMFPYTLLIEATCGWLLLLLRHSFAMHLPDKGTDTK